LRARTTPALRADIETHDHQGTPYGARQDAPHHVFDGLAASWNRERLRNVDRRQFQHSGHTGGKIVRTFVEVLPPTSDLITIRTNDAQMSRCR
jgi:hypothetical protein